MFSRGEQFSFLPFLQLPIWGPPSQDTHNQPSSTCSSATLPTRVLAAQGAEPSATHLCGDGDMQVFSAL